MQTDSAKHLERRNFQRFKDVFACITLPTAANKLSLVWVPGHWHILGNVEGDSCEKGSHEKIYVYTER